ncbi:Protocadherin-9 [Paragonimus heterotremus]|uniref:Protocadherin-9 n=1 Tax=Paragonimus heterotremus TaxID=100268 RepID=A0A8J4WJF8_9TREM|nr:Protocadherin-9 [Paragonimus heterotremus]
MFTLILSHLITAFLVIKVTCVLNAKNIQIHYALTEEIPIRTLIGNILLDSGVTNRTRSKLTCYEFASDMSHLLELERNSTNLYTNARIDREALCPHSFLLNHSESDRLRPRTTGFKTKTNKCLLEFAVVCKSYEISHEVWISLIIEIKDIDDNSPTFLQSFSAGWSGSYKVRLPEDVPVGSQHLLPSAYDADIDSNAKVRYQLLNGSSDLHHQKTFTITVKESGQANVDDDVYLTILQKLDYEQKKEYFLRLEACGLTHALPQCSSLPLHVLIQDVNDNAPRIVYPPINIHEITVSEASPIGTLLIKLEAEDADSDEAGRVTFSIPHLLDSNPLTEATVKANYTNQSLPIRLDPDTGEIRLSSSLSASAVPKYTVNILASDNGEPSLSTSLQLRINVADTNDHAPEIRIKRIGCNPRSSDSTKLTVLSNAETGTHVCLVMVSDADLYQNGHVECQSETIDDELQRRFGIGFSLLSSGRVSGHALYTLQVTRDLPAKLSEVSIKGSSLFTTLMITCKDHGEPYALTSSVSLKIRLVHQKNSELCFEHQQYGLEVEESDSPRFNLLRPQLQELVDHVRFELKPTQNMDSNCEQLQVDENTGELSFPAGTDREHNKYVRCLLVASEFDKKTITRSATTEILINLTDINDNTPKIIPNLLLTGFSLAEWDSLSDLYSEQPEGSVHIGTIVAEDLDAAENGTVRFHLKEVTAQATRPESVFTSELRLPHFQLDPSTGQLTLSRDEHRRVDRELTSSYELHVVLEDCGSVVKQSNMQTLKVHVKDVNDNPPKWDPQLIASVPTNPNHYGLSSSPVLLRIRWTLSQESLDEMSTKLRAFDPDQEENGQFSFVSLEQGQLPKSALIGRTMLPEKAYHLKENGTIQVWTSSLMRGQEYLVGVAVRDHGRARQLQSTGYFYITPDLHRENADMHVMKYNFSNFPNDVKQMATARSTNNPKFSTISTVTHSPWFSLPVSTFKLIISSLLCFGVTVIFVGGIVIYFVSRKRHIQNNEENALHHQNHKGNTENSDRQEQITSEPLMNHYTSTDSNNIYGTVNFIPQAGAHVYYPDYYAAQLSRTRNNTENSSFMQNPLDHYGFSIGNGQCYSPLSAGLITEGQYNNITYSYANPVRPYGNFFK